ncbi:hypothetical protein PUNSTDRAFT_75770 [Punctularia strigosozonata HHB-11173 SS5]|uniref:DUF6532 domain-containing protein n=1 Tax=Punctularia strigosozonata (strain HHB-11173) TaxID=741275 RepID=R7S4K5_PUNST|nr:uncharacterized protein PUNSTDRAFT_75770 [Punctularia strigosozonata HHB-11173 SS5]EIN04774.1 hypothetical protein PUNSTDRAFT_75770 [Punctularia strigosozonata HHB-11173 SS5]
MESPQRPSSRTSSSQNRAKKRAPSSRHRRDDSDGDVTPPEGSNTDDTTDGDSSWPQYTWLVKPPRGKRYGLDDQNERMRAVIQEALNSIHTDLCFVNAFPSFADKTRMVSKALVTAAQKLGYRSIRGRLEAPGQRQWFKNLSGIVFNRISTFRTKVKAAAVLHFTSYLGIKPRDKAAVAKWIADDSFIYPGSTEGYRSPVIKAVIAEAFFSKGNAIGSQNPEMFPSSRTDLPDEKEIPAPMVALAATAILCALESYKEGYFEKCPFTASKYKSAYESHLGSLLHLRKNGLAAYHFLMHELYNDAQ